MGQVETRPPEDLGQLFWDYELAALSRSRHRDWVVRRVLRQGSWQAIGWLPRQFGAEDLRRWLAAHHNALRQAFS